MFIQVAKDTFLELNFHLVEDETHCPTFNRKKNSLIELNCGVWCIGVCRAVFWGFRRSLQQLLPGFIRKKR